MISIALLISSYFYSNKASWLSGKFSHSISQSRVQVRPGAWSNQIIRTKFLTLFKRAHFKNALALCPRPQNRENENENSTSLAQLIENKGGYV